MDQVIIVMMRLDRLELSNFRSYKKKEYRLGDRTVLVGPNGAGKTNVLEAIYLLATGNSARANRTEEMIRWGAELGSVVGIINEGEEQFINLTVVLTPGVYMGKRTTKKRYLVDGVARARSRFVGRLVTVLFRPEDLRLIEGSPSRRRQYLDEVLSQADREYAGAISIYESALRRRNKVLSAISEGRANRQQLAYWDASLIKNGNIVTNLRREYVDYLCDQQNDIGKYRVMYDASTISEARLAQYYEAEIATGYTLVGPHKDDIKVYGAEKNNPKGEEDLHVYGSRGEQRLGVLFLKLASMHFLESRLGIKPMLLLDDIFSELDEEHRRQVVEIMGERQVIITTAEEDSVGMIGRAEIIRLN